MELKRLVVLLLIPFLGAGCGTAIVGSVKAVPDGAPVAGAIVEAEPGAEWVPSEADLDVETSKRGKFKIKKIPGGTYELRVSRLGFVASEPIPVEVPEGKRLKIEIELLRKAEVVGTVRFEDGSPAPNMEVLTSPPSSSTVSGIDGTFHLKEVDPGTYQLFAVGETFTSDPISVDLNPAENQMDIVVYQADAEMTSLPEGREQGGRGPSSQPMWGDGAQ